MIMAHAESAENAESRLAIARVCRPDGKHKLCVCASVYSAPLREVYCPYGVCAPWGCYVPMSNLNYREL